jgi:hypothetical protein
VDNKVRKDSGFSLGDRPCPARKCAISDAISNADLTLKRDGEEK